MLLDVVLSFAVDDIPMLPLAISFRYVIVIVSRCEA